MAKLKYALVTRKGRVISRHFTKQHANVALSMKLRMGARNIKIKKI